MLWFNKFGKTMNDVRNDVYNLMKESEVEVFKKGEKSLGVYSSKVVLSIAKALGLINSGGTLQNTNEFNDDMLKSTKLMQKLVGVSQSGEIDQNTMNKAMSVIKKKITDNATALKTANTNLTNTKTQLTTANNNLKTTKESLTKAQADLKTANTNLTNTKKQLDTTKTTLTTTQNNLKTAKTDLTNVNKELASVKTTLTEKEKMLSSATSELTEVTNKLEQAVSLADSYKLEYDNANERLKKLEETISLLEKANGADVNGDGKVDLKDVLALRKILLEIGR